MPPSIDELKNRLTTRGTETEEQYQIRIATALRELEQKDFYDIQVINDSLEIAKKELIKIFEENAL